MPIPAGEPMDSHRAAGHSVQGLWRTAEQALAASDMPAARAGYEALLGLEPAHAGALLRLSTLATGDGRVREAVARLLVLAADPPHDPGLLLTLSSSLHRLGESEAALACLRHPAWARCRAPSLLEQAARTAGYLEDFATADRMLRAAEALGGASASIDYAIATHALFAGDTATARARFGTCLVRRPDHAAAHWALARLQRQTDDDNHVARLRSALETAGTPAQAAYLGFALFKELDDLGDLPSAWQALMRGCDAKRAQLDASPVARNAATDEAAAFEALHALWADAAQDSPPEPAAVDAPTPIFIVGMPRTGTTLLERVLAGVDGVVDAGELDDIPLQLRWIADRFSRTFQDARVFDAARAVLRRQPALLRQRYLAHAAWRIGDARWFTDKLPLNVMHLGFICEAFPDAPVLHMVRDPMDTCFSNLKELFNEAYPYSYSLDALATHYGRYRRLLARWHARFPGRILDVPYAQLVTAPEDWARRVIDFCGLPWDPRCVDIASTGGAVTTASSVQVREGIHARGVSAWRRYAAPLEPLRARLQADGWVDANGEAI